MLDNLTLDRRYSHTAWRHLSCSHPTWRHPSCSHPAWRHASYSHTTWRHAKQMLGCTSHLSFIHTVQTMIGSEMLVDDPHPPPSLVPHLSLTHPSLTPHLSLIPHYLTHPTLIPHSLIPHSSSTHPAFIPYLNCTHPALLPHSCCTQRGLRSEMQHQRFGGNCRRNFFNVNRAYDIYQY